MQADTPIPSLSRPDAPWLAAYGPARPLLCLLSLAVTMEAKAQIFLATAITSKESTSEYATSKNAFYVSDTTLRGQCT